MTSKHLPNFKITALAVASAGLLLYPETDAAELLASDRVQGDSLGHAVSLNSGNAIASAIAADVGHATYSGACYFFKNTPTGAVFATESLKLIPSDLESDASFGDLVALSENLAVVTKSYASAYLYIHLDTSHGTVTENAKLVGFKGFDISLSGTSGLLGTSFYRHLDQITGDSAPNVILSASDQGIYNYYCDSNSLSGNSALVGYTNNSPQRGGTYYYRDVSTATGTITENAKLLSPQTTPNGRFGYSVSLSGNRALVGAPELTIDTYANRGEAYYFRNLDTAAGEVSAQARLRANPAYLKAKDEVFFGGQVNLSGDSALLSAPDSACLFLRLDQASGIVYEDVKIYSSMVPDSPIYGEFGGSVSIDGDKFAISNPGSDFFTGVVYSGSISALTTANAGNTFKAAAGVSFVSHLNWIAGETTDNNLIALAGGDIATVLDAGKAVYIGKNAGSDNNLLDIAGTLNCLYVYIGSTAGNVKNTLQVESTGKITATALRLAKGNRLLIAGTPAAAKTFLQSAPLQVFAGNAWKTVTTANYKKLVSVSQSGGYTVIVPL